jgi:predicted ArsR family transcriptional regulator
MFVKTIRDISRPHWFPIIDAVKRSTGLSVPELAKKLDMSYMGVKKHCLSLEKLGYLDTWRRPKVVGRPEKLYRLTEKANGLFPQIGNEVTLSLLEAATQADANAAEKLLFAYFNRQTESLMKKVRGDTVAERAASLAKIREQAGHLSECVYSREDGLCIVEYHNPLQALFDRYPTLDRMEEQQIERILNAPVDRIVDKASGLRRVIFKIGTL